MFVVNEYFMIVYGWVSILLCDLMKIFDDLICNNFVRVARLDKDDR